MLAEDNGSRSSASTSDGCEEGEAARNRGSNKSEKKRRQYTIKGIEDEAIDLMRSAAQSEGMKIGPWVSQRMTEAAKLSLGIEPDLPSPQFSYTTGLNAIHEKASPNLPSEEVILALHKSLSELQTQCLRMENEMRQITNGQMAILTGLLSKQSANETQ